MIVKGMIFTGYDYNYDYELPAYFNIDGYFFLKGPGLVITKDNPLVLSLYEKANQKIQHIKDMSEITRKMYEFNEVLWGAKPRSGKSASNQESLEKRIIRNRDEYSYITDGTFTWSAYFGFLALCHLQEFEELRPIIEAHYSGSGEKFDEEVYFRSYVASAIEALNSIWFIEYLDEIEINRKKELSSKNRRASQIKHESGTLIKQRFVNLCLDNFEKFQINKTDFARRFYRTLSVDDQREICPSKKEENAIRTLISAIKDHLEK